MPASSNILERLRWNVGLGLVIVAAGFAANAAPSNDAAPELARSSWGIAADTSDDVARSSWGAARSSDSDDAVVDVARSSWGAAAATADDDDA